MGDKQYLKTRNTEILLKTMKNKAYELAENPNSFYVDQFGSSDVIKGYISMGKEITNKFK